MSGPSAATDKYGNTTVGCSFTGDCEPRIRADERHKVVQEVVDYLNSGEFRGAHLANRFAAAIAREFGEVA